MVTAEELLAVARETRGPLAKLDIVTDALRDIDRRLARLEAQRQAEAAAKAARS